MTSFPLVAYLILLTFFSQAPSGMQQIGKQTEVTKEEAIVIAKEAAAAESLRLDSYDFVAVDEGQCWHVIVEPKDRSKNNVEPTYLILKLNGQVLEKTFRYLHPRSIPDGTGISHDKAISIARTDALKSGEPLQNYEVHAMDERDFWHVIFTLKNKALDGGGVDYLIDKKSGKIREKKLYQ